MIGPKHETSQIGDEATVSVVVPVFNRAHRVLEAAASALGQTMSPMEIIIVDDGSTDGIEKIDFNAVDSRIRLIRQPIKRGGGAARNVGIDAALGNWTALLDSDDLWMPTKLEKQFAHFSAERNGAELVGAANVLMRRAGRPDRLYNKYPPPPGVPLSEYFLLHDSTFQTSTLLLPTPLARTVRFDERLSRHQDWDFVLRLEKREVIFSYIHEPLVIYDDSRNTERVSQVRDTEPTLVWYRIAHDMLTPHARHVHYMRTQFVNDFRQDSMAALGRLLSFTLAYRLGPLYVAKHIADVVGRIGKRACWAVRPKS